MLVFYNELLALYPNPKMGNHPSSVIHNCLYNIFIHRYPSHLEAVYLHHNLRTYHAVVTGRHITLFTIYFIKIYLIIILSTPFVFQVCAFGGVSLPKLYTFSSKCYILPNVTSSIGQFNELNNTTKTVS
jgi:hypothetical protein